MKMREGIRLQQVRRGLVVVAAGVGLLSTGAAQPKDPPVGVAVKIWTRGIVYPENETGSVEISGSFLPSTPGGSDGNASAYSSSSYWEAPIGAVLGTNGYVRVEPGKAYVLTVTGIDYYSADVNIVTPPGYRVIMDQVQRTRVSFEGSANIVFELQPLSAKHPGLAGMAWRCLNAVPRLADIAGQSAQRQFGR